MTLAEVNLLDLPGFTGALGHLFEYSPWVAAAAWSHRPFDSVATLHRRMMDVLAEAEPDAQLLLIRAHPDLAGKAALENQLTDDSTREQSGAGLNRLSAEEFSRFHTLNTRYRQKFGFPFIICARKHDKSSIFAAFERRLDHSGEEEHQQALDEIGQIVWLRLSDLVTAA